MSYMSGLNGQVYDYMQTKSADLSETRVNPTGFTRLASNPSRLGLELESGLQRGMALDFFM